MIGRKQTVVFRAVQDRYAFILSTRGETLFARRVTPRKHLGHSDVRTNAGRAVTPCFQISCRRFIYNAADHYATRTQWHCARRASSHPTGTHACAPGRTIRNAGPAMPRRGFETPMLRVCGDTVLRVNDFEHRRPVKISTFRPLLIRRPLRRPSPLIAMRSDFDE